MKCIEKKEKSAAAFICNLWREIPFQAPGYQLMKDIVRVVALLGAVWINQLGRPFSSTFPWKNGKLDQRHNLSRCLHTCRILAERLGEDQMLAVVCRSYEAASKLENYGLDGKIDHENAHSLCSSKRTGITYQWPVSHYLPWEYKVPEGFPCSNQ